MSWCQGGAWMSSGMRGPVQGSFIAAIRACTEHMSLREHE
jgi:hypothetical protein